MKPIALLRALTAATLLCSPFSATLSAQADPAVEQARRESEFAALLTGARLVGYTTLGDSPELQADSYTLTRVGKQADGKWLFEAAIEFGGRKVPIKMPLDVVWAGDTPVISVTDLGFPLMGTYSARVLFYDEQYVGVWTGKDHGGQMFGRVERAGAGAEAGADEEGGKEEEGGENKGQGQAAVPPLPAREGVDWPGFRGPHAAGVADTHASVVEWDLEKEEHVRWRVEIPGLAHSSPVIWGDRIVVTSAIRLEGEQELRVGLYGSIAPVQDASPFGFVVQCHDKESGALVWERTAWEGVPRFKRHPKGSHAASTPAISGRHILAFFGSEGLYCYDMDGALLWQKDFGALDSGYYLVKDAQWGFSSSPVLYDGLAIVQCDVQEGSFVAALDAETGEEVWRTPREDVPTWSTPTVVVSEDREQVVCNGFKHIGGYDLRTGAELWRLEGGGDIPVPTPVVAEELIFITNAHGRMAPIFAIRADASGTLTRDPEETEALVWSDERRGNYMQTPLVYGEEIYFCSDAGILACYDVQTGDAVYRERLGVGQTGFTGSGVASDGKLYFTSEEGDVYVVRAGRTFELLAENALGEECMSTPAISEGVLYFRSRTGLVALGD